MKLPFHRRYASSNSQGDVFPSRFKIGNVAIFFHVPSEIFSSITVTAITLLSLHVNVSVSHGLKFMSSFGTSSTEISGHVYLGRFPPVVRVFPDLNGKGVLFPDMPVVDV